MAIVYPASCDSSSESIKVTGSTDSYFSNGKVGIGTSSPAHDLHIKNSSVSRTRIESTAANSHAGVEIKNDAMAWLFQIQGSDGDKLYVWDEDASASRLTIDTSGRVGIGTTSPASRLEVDGGDIEVDDSSKGLVLRSPNGTRWRITVDNSGNLNTSSI